MSVISKNEVVATVTAITGTPYNKPSEPKDYPTMSVGDIVCQGDIALEFLGEEYVPGDKFKKQNRRKIALGDGPGAQHIVSPTCKATLYWVDGFNEPPIIHAHETLLLEHRGGNHSHQNITCPPGWYWVRWQDELWYRVLD